MTGERRPATIVDSRSQLRRIGLGFAVAAVLLAVLATEFGLEELQTTLSTAALEWILVACLSTCACFLAWARSWQLILGVAGVDESLRTLVPTYAAAMFANSVTPMGQAGGEPFIAYVLSRETDSSYEDSLASVVTADLLNLIASYGMATMSLGALVWRIDLPESVESVAGGLAVVAVGAAVLVTVGLRFRTALDRSLLRVATPVVRRIPKLSVAGLRERLRDLRAAFDRIASEPRLLARALALSSLGWALYVLPLYFAGRAVGFAVDPLVAFFVVSASMLAGYVPSPGGLGTVEAALTGLLVALVALPATDAYAVSLVYRLSTYWLTIGVGGIAALTIVRRG